MPFTEMYDPETNGFQSMLFLTPPKLQDLSNAPSPFLEGFEISNKVNLDDDGSDENMISKSVLKILDGTP